MKRAACSEGANEIDQAAVHAVFLQQPASCPSCSGIRGQESPALLKKFVFVEDSGRNNAPN
jgi:hypothetical protein